MSKETRQEISKYGRRKNAVETGEVPPFPHPISPKRIQGEGFDDYKLRMAFLNRILKNRKQGKYFNAN